MIIGQNKEKTRLAIYHTEEPQGRPVRNKKINPLLCPREKNIRKPEKEEKQLRF